MSGALKGVGRPPAPPPSHEGLRTWRQRIMIFSLAAHNPTLTALRVVRGARWSKGENGTPIAWLCAYGYNLELILALLSDRHYRP